MDVFNKFTWADSSYEDKAPVGFESILENSIIVYDQNEDRYWTRHIAFSKILSSLPFGFLFGWILRIPGLEKIFGWEASIGVVFLVFQKPDRDTGVQKIGHKKIVFDY